MKVSDKNVRKQTYACNQTRENSALAIDFRPLEGCSLFILDSKPTQDAIIFQPGLKASRLEYRRPLDKL
jgi:hypothetical protein